VTNSDSDSLAVDYIYWWPKPEPFIGLCGDEYSLVFIGIVKEINPPDKDTSSLYTSQKGRIEITEAVKTKELAKEKYNGQRCFLSDCFYGAGVEKGDQGYCILL